MLENNKELLEIYKSLYESLLDFGQDKQTPRQKLDFVKARVYDTSVLIKRLEKSLNADINSIPNV